MLLLLPKVLHHGRMVMSPLNHLHLQMIGLLPHLQFSLIHLVRIQGSTMGTMTTVILPHFPLLDHLTITIPLLSLVLEDQIIVILLLSRVLEVQTIAILLHFPALVDLIMEFHHHSIQVDLLQYVMINRMVPLTFRDLIPLTIVGVEVETSDPIEVSVKEEMTITPQGFQALLDLGFPFLREVLLVTREVVEDFKVIGLVIVIVRKETEAV